MKMMLLKLKLDRWKNSVKFITMSCPVNDDLSRTH